MVSRVNFLETEPGRIDDVARVVREVVELILKNTGRWEEVIRRYGSTPHDVL